MINETLPAVRPQYDPDEAQIALIQQQFGFDMNKQDDVQSFKMFMHHARKTGLDPLARQIYAIKRRSRQKIKGNWVWIEKTTIQMSIDGFRLVAERSGHYHGQLGPEWCGEDGVWKNVWTKTDLPVAARVAIIRDDFKEPLWSVARMSAYMPVYHNDQTGETTPTGLWARMAPEMLAKCAEALSLRRGFPMELSGYYTDDEMKQAGGEDAEERKIEKPEAEPNAMGPLPLQPPPDGGGNKYPDKRSGAMDPKPEPLKAAPVQAAPVQAPAAPVEVARNPKPAVPFNNENFPLEERLTLAEMAALESEAKEAADFGSYAFSQFWSRIGREPKAQTKRKYLNGTMQDTLREKMDAADARMVEGGVDPETGEEEVQFGGQ